MEHAQLETRGVQYQLSSPTIVHDPLGDGSPFLCGSCSDLIALQSRGAQLEVKRFLLLIALEQVPQELVVDLVVILHFGRFDEGA